MAIAPIPTTRVSDMLVRRRLLAQFQSDQQQLFRVQTQLSTGRRIELPSDDAPAAVRAASLQALIERKEQVGVNTKIGESFLNDTESALQTVSDILVDIRALAVSAVDTVASDTFRAGVAEEVSQAIQTLVNAGNKRLLGRYLFAGSRTDAMPFDLKESYVEFLGNENTLENYADIGLLFETSLNGNEVFGAISEPVRGSIDVGPALATNTLLSDLNGGLGIAPGSITVGAGSASVMVDLSGAVTIGDVAGLIEANPPAGRSVVVTVAPTGLLVELDPAGGGQLTISEVGQGSTASDLGILGTSAVVGGPLVGQDLNPRLTATTRLDDILGTRAFTRLVSAGANNDLTIRAAANGAQWNGVAVQLVHDEALAAAPGLAAGSEVAEFDPAARQARASLALADANDDLIITAVSAGTDFNQVAISLVDAGDVKNNPTATYTDVGGVRTLTLGIDDNDETTLNDLVGAINATGLFTAAADPSAGEGFNGAAAVRTANAGVIKGNTGQSGGNANTLYVRVHAGGSTAGDVAAAINAEGTFTAETDASDAVSLNLVGTGPVDLAATATTAGGSGAALDRDSGLRVTNGGKTFAISFTGAETVQDLLNALNGAGAGLLAQINQDGNGIDVRSTLSGVDFAIGENGGSTATQLGLRTFNAGTTLAELNKGAGVEAVTGTDFIVERNDGVRLNIDVSAAKTVGDVIDLINNNANNQDGAAAVVARLAQFGNGIELVDDNPTGLDSQGQPNQLKILTANNSFAAEHLGLVPAGATTGSVTSPAVAPTGVAVLTGPNNDLTFTAAAAGTQFGGTRVVFVSSAASGDQALVSYDAPSQTLSVDIDPGNTRAVTILNAVNAEGTFAATLNTASEANDGTGPVTDLGQVATLDAGAAETLTGADVNPLETKGVFNSLFRLQRALLTYDPAEIERTVSMLKVDARRVNFARANLGAQQQGVAVLQDQLDGQMIELRAALSDSIDVDLAEAISNLTARQASFQASLQATASILRMTLMDFL